ncbi:Ankyrin repeat [Sesbania bispinosa]|nr:Ankyrin repeat [Sesbania bispinosa]
MAEDSMNITTVEGQSVSKPPYFDGTNHTDWKERMRIFIQSVDFKLWLVIKKGPKIPKKRIEGKELEKSEDEFNDEDMKNMEQEAKAKNILYCAVNPDALKKISRCKTAKEMWEELVREDAKSVVDSTTTTPELQKDASAQYNTPNLEFIDGTRFHEFFNNCVPLHKFALEGNWPAAKRILDQDEKLKRAAIASGWPTVLHIAAGANHVHFVEHLLTLLTDEDIILQDIKGNTAFCFAAASGNLKIAQLMLEKNQHLPIIRGGNGFTPVQFAALQGRCKMAYLALRMARKRKQLAFARDENDETALHLLAQNQKPLEDSCQCQSPEQQDPIMINPGMKQHLAFQLVKFLWTTILNEKDFKSEMINFIRKPSQLLFVAAEVGNFGFLSELISAYPSLIWEVNSEDQSIIHTAVLHRHPSIYNLIHEIGYYKDIIVRYVDEDGNILLHLAAKLAPPGQLELVSGAAFQMCLELLWFEDANRSTWHALALSTIVTQLTTLTIVIQNIGIMKFPCNYDNRVAGASNRVTSENPKANNALDKPR